MAKILLSWTATMHDFIGSKGEVNTEGPNCVVHEQFYDYDYHVLLTSASHPSEDTKYQLLVNHLHKTYKHKIVEVALGIKGNDIISPSIISHAINTMLLTRFKHDEIDVFISPGTPAMQFAWYLAQISLGLDMRLFQTVKPNDNKGNGSKQIWISSEQTGYISSLLVKESLHTKPVFGATHADIDILRPIYSRASQIALSDVSVLITGSTGTGKELLAEHLHKKSYRSSKKIVSINCAAFRDDLLESRLFGYVEGAFTGANRDQKGLFEEAEGGTIFLDEIGDISPYMQQTLLRVLSKNEILPVGATKTKKINARVVAATNKDIYSMSMEEKYRADLYYRLSTCELHLPSLEHYSPKDKQGLFDFLWQKAKLDFKTAVEPKLDATTRKKLLTYNYPGNIREMQNIIYGIWAEYLPQSKKITLPARLLHPHKSASLKLEDVVRQHVRKVFADSGENISKTAEILGVQPNTVRSKLK
ncbi:MAG: sigma 54-interacting transcriptional regulator [Chitinophagales bacterium]|nr:sigma 54-interacting transcriptional regulator [Chitinophagales bacterium]